MIPASSRAFLVTNLVSGIQYDLCVLAIWDDTATTLTATNVVGCAQFVTRDDYPQCQSLHSHFLGGTMILVIGGVIVATLLVFIVILMVRYKVCSSPQSSKLPAVSNTYSQTNGGQAVRNGLPPQTAKPAAGSSAAATTAKVVVRDELMEFKCGSLQSSLSSSSSSLGPRDADRYSPRSEGGGLSGKWRPGPSRARPNLNHLLGAFASLELRGGQGREPGPSGMSGGGATGSGKPSDKEPLLGRTDSRLSRLLTLPLETRPKRSQSFDMGDFTSTQCLTYPPRISSIWTKRSLSVNGMLLQCEEAELEGSKAAFESSEWVMESTV